MDIYYLFNTSINHVDFQTHNDFYFKIHFVHVNPMVLSHVLSMQFTIFYVSVVVKDLIKFRVLIEYPVYTPIHYEFLINFVHIH